MKPEDKIDLIQEKLQTFSDKKVELEKNLSIVEWLFTGDPELKEIERRITDLKNVRDNYFKVIQVVSANQNAAANPPPPLPIHQEKDYSHFPLYWKRLTYFGLNTPAEQLNAYFGFVGGTVGFVYGIGNIFKAYHLQKMVQLPENTEMWKHHWFRAGGLTLQQIEFSSYWIRRFKAKGAAGLLAPVLFVSYLANKMKRIKKD